MAQISIQPVFIWVSGVEITATKLNAYSILDNLETKATFFYSLLDENETTLISGYINIQNDNYIQWLANDFSTNWIMNWIAAQLNLTPIIPTKTKK
jgi:hypothetical protein